MRHVATLVQTAHNKILDCEPTEAIPESKKPSDFVKGITDLKLESTMSVVLGNLRVLHDVQMCLQYLSTTVENRATLRRARIGISGDKSSGTKKDKGKLPKSFKLKNKYYPQDGAKRRGSNWWRR
ncbi:hypothetical protein MHU86_7358 [Fragilaria crotonensis]|nr:hypothetical protein MHU86_7358 [Fragilaria crotonensis]